MPDIYLRSSAVIPFDILLRDPNIPDGGTTQYQSVAGVLSMVGDLATLLIGAPDVFYQAAGGAIALAGALRNKTAKIAAGALSLAGDLHNKTAKITVGVLSLAGDLYKETAKIATGALSLAGGLYNKTMKVVGGALSMSGDMSIGSRIYYMALAGAVDLYGQVSRKTARALAAVLALVGAITRARTVVVPKVHARMHRKRVKGRRTRERN